MASLSEIVDVVIGGAQCGGPRCEDLGQRSLHGIRGITTL